LLAILRGIRFAVPEVPPRAAAAEPDWDALIASLAAADEQPRRRDDRELAKPLDIPPPDIPPPEPPRESPTPASTTTEHPPETADDDFGLEGVDVAEPPAASDVEIQPIQARQLMNLGPPDLGPPATPPPAPPGPSSTTIEQPVPDDLESTIAELQAMQDALNQLLSHQ